MHPSPVELSKLSTLRDKRGYLVLPSYSYSTSLSFRFSFTGFLGRLDAPFVCFTWQHRTSLIIALRRIGMSALIKTRTTGDFKHRLTHNFLVARAIPRTTSIAAVPGPTLANSHGHPLSNILSLCSGIPSSNTTQQTTCHPVQGQQATFVPFMYTQERGSTATRMRTCISRPAMSKYSLSNAVYFYS